MKPGTTGLLISAVPEIVLANLQLHLDAGDAASYPGSGQTWFDLTANHYDFFLGSSDTPTTDDPTFHGSAGGKSGNEYFSFDGGDCFRAAAAYAGSIIRTAGRRDQPFTIETYWWHANTTSDMNFFANGFAAGSNAIYYQWSATNARQQMRMLNADTLDSNDTDVSASAWHQHAISGQLNGSTGIHVIDGVQDGTFAMTTGWTAGDSATNGIIAGRIGDSALRPPNGDRVAIVRIYDRALTVDELAQNFAATRGRFSI